MIENHPIADEWDDYFASIFAHRNLEPALADLLRAVFFSGACSALHLAAGGTEPADLLAELRAFQASLLAELPQ